MKNNMKTCKNGHTYDSKLSECPYCPKPSMATRASSDKTIVENQIRAADDKAMDNTIVLNPPQEFFGDKIGQKYKRLIGWLVTFDLNPEGIDYKIREGKTTIGRGVQNDIAIQSSEISDEHCTFLYRNGKLLLNDNLSTNGTFLNEEMIEDRAYVKNDDLITIGKITFKLKII